MEKGMSIGNARPGFGKAKAADLLSDLQNFLDAGGSKSVAGEICSVIDKYVDYNALLGADMSDIKHLYCKFIDANSIPVNDYGGYLTLRKDDIFAALHRGFPSFAKSRYAVRDFGNEKISLEEIEKALQIAEKAPSACNRQSWKVHVYSKGPMYTKLLELQGGNRGFGQDMQYAILVCCDLMYYRFFEMNQLFVDGGLYAMSLLYALHHCGIASIPLTMSQRMSLIRRVIREMGLPEGEMPVLVIGVGSYKDEFRVAKSERVAYKNYTSFE